MRVCTGERGKQLVARLCHPVTSEATSISSQQHVSMRWTRMTPTWVGGWAKPRGLTPTQEPEKTGSGWGCFHRKENTNWLCNVKWSSLKMYIQVTLHGVNLLYLGIYINIQYTEQLVKTKGATNVESREMYMAGFIMREKKWRDVGIIL